MDISPFKELEALEYDCELRLTIWDIIKVLILILVNRNIFGNIWYLSSKKY